MDAPSTSSEACSVTASDLPTDPVFALHRGGKIEILLPYATIEPIREQLL